nr:hypothetical protein [Tanacetum cinerariifolium]
MVESENLKKQKVQEQIDAQVARELEEQLEREDQRRIKRKGLSLEQESAKKQKTPEEVTEEAKSSDEVPEENVKEMMQLVPIEKVYVEALQVKHPIIDWKVHTEGQRSYWKITRPPTSDKEMELWVELSRLYEPDDEDQLWTHTQNFIYTRLQILQDIKGRIVGSKMHKAFPLPGIEFPLAEEVPTTSEEGFHCQKKRDATARKIALLLKSRRNCQSKSNDSFT